MTGPLKTNALAIGATRPPWSQKKLMRIFAKTVFSATLAGLLVSAQGQWLNYPTPGTPRTRDGKPNLSAPQSTRSMKTGLIRRLGHSSHRLRES
ncbi:MAG TPA: hypothetical protein VK789_25030 [Bryobacteraceae bacterium]|nr:hypothetical protein [Bryobacteraceae bacterium]